VRGAAGELDVLQAAGDLAERVVEGLAVLGGQQPGDLLAAGVEQVAEAEHHLGPAAERCRPPARGRRAGGADRGTHLLRRGERDPGLLLAGRRVPHRRVATGGIRHLGPADQMPDRPHRRLSPSGSTQVLGQRRTGSTQDWVNAGLGQRRYWDRPRGT
jgi:hypothetical protein